MPAASRFVADAAAHVRVIAGAVDANLHELAGTAATRAAVRDAVRAAAERLRAASAGLFVLSYAGHGARLRDASGDEYDGLDEAWALDDAPLTDDVLTELLAELHADVHVVVISNCCFSAGMLDGVGDGLAGGVSERLAGAPPPIGRWAMGSSDNLPAVDVRALAVSAAATNRIVIASCCDQQMMVLPDSSRLTLRVLEAVFPLDGVVRRRQATDYAAVEATVRSMASVTQTPVLLATDPDKRRRAFVAQPLRLE
jgi:hypothetical protein